MISKFIDNLFPVAGGFGGSMYVLERTVNNPNLLWMTFYQWCEAIIMIAIGGIIGGAIGWLVKRWLDNIFPQKKKP